MDKTEIYIKMCDHPKIQSQRENWEPGDFVVFDESVWVIGSPEEPEELWRECGQLWLPRLDQWVGLGGMIDTFTELNRFSSGYYRAWSAGAGGYVSGTPEQACCLAYMAQQGYKWTVGGWEVV